VSRIELPRKLIPVFTGEALFRGAYGGRGSAKTRSFAKMSAVRGLQCAKSGESGVIVCGREFQNSLDESAAGGLEGSGRPTTEMAGGAHDGVEIAVVVQDADVAGVVRLSQRHRGGVAGEPACHRRFA
jgi:hypothetical protein